jgi:uncharacterized protein YndB with AHSA1/START domain
METTKVKGQTKDVGFEIGVRKTFPVTTDKTWDFLFSKNGINDWLGIVSGELTLNTKYRTKDGTEGTVKVFKPSSHIRLTWKKKEWPNTSTVQIRVINAKKGTTISFHQEKLLDAIQRSEMKKHWEDILAKSAENLK